MIKLIDDISIQQDKILKIAKKISKNNTNFNFEGNYLACWSGNLGNSILHSKFRNKKNFFSNFLIYFYHYLSFKKNYETINFYNPKKKYKNLIFSYYTTNTKNLFDDFFSTNLTKTKNSLWVILNTSLETNFKFKNCNIILINCISINKLIKNFLLPFYLIKALVLFIFNFEITNIRLFNTFDNLVDKIKGNLLIKFNFFLPFEAQPHQLYLLKIIKKTSKYANTFGYLHSCLPPLPTEFFFKNTLDNLDKLIVHGIDQSWILKNFLGWKTNKILLSKSFRYTKSNIKRNSIYLPYAFNNPDIILNSIKFIFESGILKNRFYFNVINHPHQTFSRKHIKLIKDINLIITSYKKEKIIPSEYSIFIGATASIIEALEMNIKVLHISSNPEFEFHNNKIWKSFDIKPLNSNVLVYKLFKRNRIINFGKKNYFLKRFSL